MRKDSLSDMLCAYHLRICGSDPSERGSNLQVTTAMSGGMDHCMCAFLGPKHSAGTLQHSQMAGQPGPHGGDSAPEVAGEGAIQVRGRSISREPDRPVGHVCCHHGDIPEHLQGQQGESLGGGQIHSFLGINSITGNM